ncbi:failed axon connections homolog [Montipora foliosa]|uniref:failed axon connections homolog n=1 Tax=Montipora foliosa TaxID=591990 RepID=UPI0035F1ECBA
MAAVPLVEEGYLFYSLLFVISVLLFGALLTLVQSILFFLRLWAKPQKTARDGVVLLHQMPPNNRVLNVSPPSLKLETYLRMCRIPYESDYGFRMSSKGKVPWIEFNEKSIADSNFIVRFLNEEFSVDPDDHLSAVEKAISHTMLVTLEENTYWTLIYHSFVADIADTRVMSPLLSAVPFPLKYALSWWASRYMQSCLWAHGIGRHASEDIYKIAERDLKAVSQLLGKKKFVMGRKPCLLDAALFALVSVLIWNVPGSPQAKLIRSELKNLEEHCYNIKEEYFPDWDQLMLKHK